MFVAATTRCFCNLGWDAAIERLAELEYSFLEIMLHDEDGHLKPNDLLTDFDKIVFSCRNTMRLVPIALSFDSSAPEEVFLRQFQAACELANLLKIVTLTVRAAELGTPYNAEIERLQTLVRLASVQGVKVCMLSEQGRMSHDPLTAAGLCGHVRGLGITFDPSHYIFGIDRPIKLEPIYPFVRHLRLRDTRQDAFQVRVGQGSVEYGRLINHLGRFNYNRALCVDMLPQEGVDHLAEMRKMRLLLESLL